jgi:hypothetical protein
MKMKAKLIFNLPDDQYDYDCAVNGAKYKHALEALSTAFRNEMKSKYVENAEHFMDIFWETLNEQDVRLHHD